jgi:hypothetical protein
MTLLPALQNIIGGFVRRTWLVTLVAVMVCAFFAARAVAAYVEADHLTTTGPTAAPPRVPLPKPAPAPRTPPDPSVISERNIFCSACTPMMTPGSANAYSGQPAILIATSLGNMPRATVRVIPTEAQGSWGLEDTIPGVGKITRIGAATIDVVDTAGNPKQLSLFDSSTGTSGPGAATPDPGAASKPASPFASRVKKLGDNSFEVDRDVVRELVAAGGQNTGVRAIPVMTKGEVSGLRLVGVRPTSIAAALELKSNDILSSIDGESIKTMQQLLDLYGKLDKLNGIELQGTRGGKPLAVQLKFR